MTVPDVEDADSDLPVGHRLNGFRIVAVLGRSDWSTSYLAEDLGRDRMAVLKEYNPKGWCARAGSGDMTLVARSGLARAAFDDGLVRFHAEADLLASLRHPNIVDLRTTLRANGTTYMAMDHSEGATLAQRLQERPDGLDGPELLAILRAALDGLECVHRAGHLHRDVKPANLFVPDRGGAILLDFGAALPQGPDPAGRREPSELTPGYAAPEQYLQDGEEGPWTDVYALAGVAYCVVAGAPPPDALTRLDRDSLTPAAVAGRGRFAADLLEAIDWALRLDPSERPRTARDWKARLERARTDEGVDAGPAPRAAAGEVDDGHPPTVRVKRVPARPRLGPRRPSVRTPFRAKRPRTRTGSGRRPVLLVLLTLALAAAGAFGAWQGYRQGYRLSTKSEWIADATGAGDTVSISEALARAPAGATIRVRPGVYAESLVLDKVVHLVGEGDSPGAVVVAPESGVCLAATAELGSVRGIAFRMGREGPAGDAQPCVLLDGGSLLLERSWITGGAGPALLIRNHADPTIRGNRITGGADAGIVIEGGARGTVVGNEIDGGAKSGVIVRDGAAPVVTGNAITRSRQAGVLFTSGAGGLLSGNHIRWTNASGIEVRGDAAPEVAGNRIEGAGEAGIYVYDGGRGWFRRNTIVDSGFSGVVIGDAAAPVVTDNDIRDNGEHGVFILAGAAGRVAGNRIEANAGHGVARETGAATEIGHNAMTDNQEPQVQTGRLRLP